LSVFNVFLSSGAYPINILSGFFCFSSIIFSLIG
jgi:hypothetical protein